MKPFVQIHFLLEMLWRLNSKVGRSWGLRPQRYFIFSPTGTFWFRHTLHFGFEHNMQYNSNLHQFWFQKLKDVVLHHSRLWDIFGTCTFSPTSIPSTSKQKRKRTTASESGVGKAKAKKRKLELLTYWILLKKPYNMMKTTSKQWIPHCISLETGKMQKYKDKEQSFFCVYSKKVCSYINPFSVLKF